MPGTVVVLAPSPQLTVTVEDLDGEPDVHVHAGGQGVWQSRMITSLGTDVVLCGTVGGETGTVLRHLLADLGIELRLHDVAGRCGAYLHDRRDGNRSEIVEMEADPLSRHELDDLYQSTLVEAMRAGVALLSGPSGDRVVPHSLYYRLTADLTSNGCKVLLDLAGGRLEEGLSGGPTFVKVSHEELVADGRADSGDLKDLIPAAKEIAKQGPQLVVVSRAADPALALVGGENGDLVTITVPSFEPVDTRGGGDSMTAGVAAAIAQGDDFETALRVGAAAGALNITRHGLGTGSGDAIRVLADSVELKPAKA